jgi:hypothetical protein
MKRILLSLVALLLVAQLGEAQLLPGNRRSRTIQQIGSSPFAKLASAVDTAKDNASYKAAINGDLGGRVIIYGLDILSGLDTVTAVLALEHSADSTYWTVVDSVSILRNDTAGIRTKTIDLSAYRDPYWRLRYGLGGSADDFRSSGTTANGAGDSLYLFIIANFKERW